MVARKACYHPAASSRPFCSGGPASSPAPALLRVVNLDLCPVALEAFDERLVHRVDLVGIVRGHIVENRRDRKREAQVNHRARRNPRRHADIVMLHDGNRAQRLQTFVAEFQFLRVGQVGAQVKENGMNEHDPTPPAPPAIGELKFDFAPGGAA